VRDRSGLTQLTVQDKEEVEKLRGLPIVTVLKVTGKVFEEPRPNRCRVARRQKKHEELEAK